MCVHGGNYGAPARRVISSGPAPQHTASSSFIAPARALLPTIRPRRAGPPRFGFPAEPTTARPTARGRGREPSSIDTAVAVSSSRARWRRKHVDRPIVTGTAGSVARAPTGTRPRKSRRPRPHGRPPRPATPTVGYRTIGATDLDRKTDFWDFCQSRARGVTSSRSRRFFTPVFRSRLRDAHGLRRRGGPTTSD